MQAASQDQSLIHSPPVASPQVMATDDVLSQWAAEHCPDFDLQLQASQIASRMPTWIAARSVHAGVSDIMCTLPLDITPAALEQLSDAVSRRMHEDGLFGLMQPRRTGPLA